MSNQVTLSRVAWSLNVLFPPFVPNWVVRMIPPPQVIVGRPPAPIGADVVSVIEAAGCPTVKAVEVAPVRPDAVAVSV